MTAATITTPRLRCPACGVEEDLSGLAGMGDGLIHQVHPTCSVPAGRQWSSRRDPSVRRVVRVPRGQVEATVSRGLNILWSLAYSTGQEFTAAAWRHEADVQSVPTELMAIAVHRAITRGWIQTIDLVDGRFHLEQHDRRKTRFVSLIHRPRGGRR